MSAIDLEIYQQAPNGEQRHFHLKAGRELHVTQSRAHKTSRYAFSILALMDKGKTIYSYKKNWLVMSVLPLLAMLAVPHLENWLGMNLQSYVLYILAGLSCLAMLFLLLLAKSFKRQYVFCSIHTRLPLVEFLMNKPGRKEFNEFIMSLETAIKQHKQEMNIPLNRQLAGEIRTLRRVSEAGMLSESVYQAAKAKLLIMSDENYRPSSN